jgi:bifunctional DNase/RNase
MLRRHRVRGRRALVVAVAVALAAIAGVMLWHGDAVAPSVTEPAPRSSGQTDSTLSPTAREMSVATLLSGRTGTILVLQEKGRGRYLPLTIGEREALAILRPLSGEPPPRPQTHDLLVDVLGTLHAEVIRVVVTELRGETFYARLVLRLDGREVAVDSRPSDAVAVALRAQAPIFAEAEVLDQAGVSSEQEF